MAPSDGVLPHCSMRSADLLVTARRVLVADDHPTIGDVVSRYSEAAGFAVTLLQAERGVEVDHVTFPSGLRTKAHRSWSQTRR